MQKNTVLHRRERRVAQVAGTIPSWTKFAVAGLGGACGWLPIHPLDVVKVRLQVMEGSSTKISPPRVALNIVEREGFNGLYSGLSAAMTRQLTYGTMRIGLYDIFRAKLLSNGTAESSGSAKQLPLKHKVGCGLAAGAVASTLACPVEVALVRMQADGIAPLAERRGYKNVFDAIFTVGRTEGISACWKGVKPTVLRGMVVSMTQLASYDHAKDLLLKSGYFSPGNTLNISASVCSGFLYCFTSLPIDICKVRMQNQRALSDGTLPYRNIPQTILKICRQESVFSLWKGFGPYFARGGGHTVTMVGAMLN